MQCRGNAMQTLRAELQEGRAAMEREVAAMATPEQRPGGGRGNEGNKKK